MKTYSQLRAEARESLSGRWGEAVLAQLPLVISLLLVLGISLWAGKGSGFIADASSSLILLVTFLFVIPLQFGFCVAMMQKLRGNEISAHDLMWQSFKQDYLFAVKFGLLITLIALLYIMIFYVALIIAIVVWAGQINLDADTLTVLADNPAALVELLLASPWVIIAFIALYFLLLGFCIRLELMYFLTYFIRVDHPELGTHQAMQLSKQMMNGQKWRLFVLDLTFIGWMILCAFTAGLGYFLLGPYVTTTFAAFYEDIKPAEEQPTEEFVEELPDEEPAAIESTEE